VTWNECNTSSQVMHFKVQRRFKKPFLVSHKGIDSCPRRKIRRSRIVTRRDRILNGTGKVPVQLEVPPGQSPEAKRMARAKVAGSRDDRPAPRGCRYQATHIARAMWEDFFRVLVLSFLAVVEILYILLFH
jgi:hypothetical protein